MEFICFIVWSAFCVWCGYEIGLDSRKVNIKININSLSFKQAVKFIFIHEKRRHQQDIDGINKDLNELKDIELPAEVEELAGKIRFEV